jgi:hypothetical protein
VNLQNPITDEERGKAQLIHHELGQVACEDVTFIRSYWKGQPVTVVAIVESQDEEKETLLPLAIVVTHEINDQLMPYWEMPVGEQP